MDEQDRPDVGAMAHRLVRAVADAEEPVLAEHGLSMWDYVVLGALASGSAPTQLELARRTGRDPTRLIALLDALGERDLVRREPDPRDRRRRVVALTAAGTQVLGRCRAAVRELEERLMADVAPADRVVFLGVLDRLSRLDRPGRPGP